MYTNGTKWDGGVKGHYKTMKLEEIEEMKNVIQNIAAEDCILFIWATFPNLRECLKIIESWGFEYKTLGFSWIKTNKINKKP